MLAFKKKIVTDETIRPVAVLINYQDWQRIEKLLESYQSKEEGININQYAGAIKLTEYPL
ncbi:MAG: hypothetical protein BRC48_09080 [Cyanobacteria bacterium QS_9_48_30]|nr:MAG: hypothetical protein BRC48_09080 [Cyanobacteria bacterium QS_9_48_30]